MRRGIAVALGGVALLLLVASSFASAATSIPGTTLQVVDLDTSARSLAFGGTTEFTWALYNGGPDTYSLTVTAAPSDPTVRVEVLPATFQLSRDALQEVRVNVSAPPSGTAGPVSIVVGFEVTAPIAANVSRSVTATLVLAPASVDVLTAFLAVGAIIVIGFTAAWIFERTRVPDLLILIFLGFLLGPVTLAYFGVAFVPKSVLDLVTPYFTAMALMIILFDGGLHLRLKAVVHELGIAGVHTTIAFVLSFLGVALIARLLLGYDWAVALLLGAVLDGTSGAVVIGLVRVLRVSEETKILLTLESVLTDILAVILALALIDLLRGGPGASLLLVVQELGEAFLIALAFGIVAGVVWIALLRRVEKKPFSYMLTLALLFLLYAGTEIVGGSGAMASFVFGLVLGNHEVLERRLKLRSRFVIDARIKQFHTELSFLVRTFFFVFLGLVFTLELSGTWSVATQIPFLDALNGTFALFLVAVAAIFLLTVASRLAATRVTVALRPKPRAERRVLWTVMGRGLTTAVLASLPFTIPAFISPASSGDLYYRTLLVPYQGQFLALAFFIILLTVVGTTLGIVVSERQLGRVTAVMPSTEVDAGVLAFLRETRPEDLVLRSRPPRQGG